MTEIQSFEPPEINLLEIARQAIDDAIASGNALEAAHAASDFTLVLGKEYIEELREAGCSEADIDSIILNKDQSMLTSRAPRTYEQLLRQRALMPAGTMRLLGGIAHQGLNFSRDSDNN